MYGIDLDAFVDAYIECALWSSTDRETDTPLDAVDADLTRKARAAMRRDCRAFARDHRGMFAGKEEQAGHDFWLTRNRHGAGFWDRGDYWPNRGKDLTNDAHAYGGVDLYVHRGRIHHP